MRYKLSFVIFIGYCHCMFPAKRDVDDEFSSSNSVHLSSLKLFPFFNIIMKCAFCMASNPQSSISFMRCGNWIFVFVYDISKLTLFPSECQRRILSDL